VYRPPPSKDNGLNTNFFLEHEWPIFLAKYATVDKNTIILGDLNFHLDLPDNRETKKFNSCLDACGMRQLVSEPTHVAGHTLDVVIIRDNDNIVSNIEIQDPGLSDSFGKTSRDHLAVIFEAKASKPPPIRKSVSYRKLSSINVDSFKQDIRNTAFFNTQPISSNIDDFVGEYSKQLTMLVDKHAPLRTKTIVLRPSCPWYTEQLHDLKHQKRKLERRWRESKLKVDHEMYRNKCADVNKALKQARVEYYTSKIEACGRDHKSLSKITKNLLGDTNEVILPSYSSPKQLANQFSDFFIGKIETIRNNISSQIQTDSDLDSIETDYIGVNFVEFTQTCEDEVKSIIKKSANKSCDLDPIPTWLLKDCLDELAPVMTKIINASLDAAYVPRAFKNSRIRPLLKKANLDANELKKLSISVKSTVYIKDLIKSRRCSN
jgi:hypothetical protein